jgi:hypothetical protein
MMLLVLVAFLAALGLVAALGLTPDSRDTDYSLGMVLRQRRPAAADTPGPTTDTAA